MSRPVALRVSYRNDASHLLRLEEAISKDKRQTRGWRVGTTRLARKLALCLLQAEANLVMGPEEISVKQAIVKPKKRKRSGHEQGTVA
jgi:hypothetical protein